MENLIDLIKEGKNTTSLLQQETGMAVSTLQRHLKELCDFGFIKLNAAGKNSYYTTQRPTPTIIEILEKLRLIHQQKSMSKSYRSMTRENKGDAIIQLYIDTFPGKVEDYNEELHSNNIYHAWCQIEKEI